MIIDGLLQFDPAGTAITAGGASTNVLDFVNARDMGVGDDPALKLVCQVGTAFAASGAATLNIQYQVSNDNSTFNTVAESGAIAVGNLTAGSRQFQIDVPVTGTPYRYHRLNYAVGTGPFTAGTIQSAIVLERGSNNAYAPGVVVNN